MSEDDCDIIFKVVLVGDSGVGKTNVLNRYLKNEFNFDTKATVGVEFGTKRFEINNRKVKALLWDTAGQERFKSITSQYYKGAKGALLIYDLTRRQTFENIDTWITDLRNNGDNIHILLIGNKCDNQNERVVSYEEGEKKAKLYSIIYFYHIYWIFGDKCIYGYKYR